jgi:cellulose biosynthesis protein BcsQ
MHALVSGDVKSLSTTETVRAPLGVLLAASGKGGVGRTSIIASIGHTLAAEYQRDVVYADTDYQASLTRLLGAQPSQQPLHDPPVAVHGMRLFAAGAALRAFSAPEIEAHLARALAAASGGILLVDTRPDLLDHWHATLLARRGTFVLAVADVAPAAIPELLKLAAMAESYGRDYLIIGNRDTRRRTSTRAKDFLQTSFSSRLARAWVPTGKQADLAFEHGTPATAVDPQAPFTRAVHTIVDQLITQGVA